MLFIVTKAKKKKIEEMPTDKAINYGNNIYTLVKNNVASFDAEERFLTC